jgi:hypothetical protein
MDIEPQQQADVQANTSTALDTELNKGPVIPEKFQAETTEGSLTKALESYSQLESKMGSMYSIPSEDSGPEKWQEFEQRIANTGKFVSRPDSTDPEAMNKFYTQLGRPESAEDYKVQIAEEVRPYVDDNMYKNYTHVAHTAGLNNEQAQVLLDFEVQRMNQQAEHTMQVKAQAEQNLRQNWGAEYDTRLAGAKSAIGIYSEKYPDAVNELLNGPAGNNPALIAMLSELGDSLRESGHAGASGTPQYGMSSDDAKDKIQEIKDNKSHPYWSSHDPGHSAAVDKMKTLYSIAHPEG